MEEIIVRIISQEKKRVLIQYVEDDRVFRKVVSKDDIDGNRVKKNILEEAPEVGLDWESLPDIVFSAREIREVLHHNSIFDENDLSNPERARNAAREFGKKCLAIIQLSIK